METEQQRVTNSSPIGTQLNVNSITGDINLNRKGRLAQKFKKLKEEVENKDFFEGFLEDFKHYNTTLDGVPMPIKLRDAGFSERDIDNATRRKHQYAKKLEEFSLYKTAQAIDLEIFALVCNNFETYVEPLIDNRESLAKIKECVREKIVAPIHHMLDSEGQDDTLLDYNINHIYGMIYFLTGMCHLNWVNYDRIQPGI